jgi:sugar lactone lactonase YvrE
VTADELGNIFVADMSNDTIRKITPAGKVSTLAGPAAQTGNADGPGNEARFDNPFAVAVDGAGNVYVADSANDTIRKITAAGEVVTVAGLSGYPGDSDGSASTARFSNPAGLAVDGAGNIFVADSGNNTIRKITPAGIVSTLPELAGAGSAGESVQLKSPGGVAVDNAGNIYIADSSNHCIRKIAVAR